MRIAQVAPLWEQLPPESHRSVEFSVIALTDELVRRGHDVTLFAAAESDSLAWLEPGAERALLKQNIRLQDYPLYEQMQLGRVFNAPGRFDLIHVHDCLAALPYASLSKTPVLHTVYRQPRALEERFYRQHRRQPLVAAYPGFSQSSSARRLRVLETIPAAIAPESFTFYGPSSTGQPYLAYLGDLSAASGLTQAIAIARASGLSLQIAALQDEIAEPAFFDGQVAPRIDGNQVKFLGRISSGQRNEFLGLALATLSMRQSWVSPPWEIMESLASGTPVIAMNPLFEPLLGDGKVGLVGETVEDCVAAIQTLPKISRQACRHWALSRFGATALADGYEVLYRRLLQPRRSQGLASTADLQAVS